MENIGKFLLLLLIASTVACYMLPQQDGQLKPVQRMEGVPYKQGRVGRKLMFREIYTCKTKHGFTNRCIVYKSRRFCAFITKIIHTC